MSQDEVIKIVGGIVIVILVVSVVIFFTNQSKEDLGSLTDDAMGGLDIGQAVQDAQGTN